MTIRGSVLVRCMIKKREPNDKGLSEYDLGLCYHMTTYCLCVLHIRIHQGY